jgi:signal peptidase I
VSFWKINLTQLPEYIIPQNMKNKQYYYIFSAPKTGDIVVFKYPDDISRSFVKRVVGINGDRVQIINGKLILNDTIINESYLNQKNISRENWGPGIIGPNQYFVLGDNRTASNDSREWGTISDQHVIGKYLFDYGSRLCKISPANR